MSDATREEVSNGNQDAVLGVHALQTCIDNATEADIFDVTEGIHAHGDEVQEGESSHPPDPHKSRRHRWLERLIPGVELLAAKHHVGNFVAIRDSSKPPGSMKIWESMPIYARIGMHILFYGREQVKLLEKGTLDHILREKSVKQGEIYNSPESTRSIPSFIRTYKINTEELFEPDISKYKNFNEFFYRKLKSGARPVRNTNPKAFCCAADCRLVVYSNVQEAQKFWIKGDEFTVDILLHGPSTTHARQPLPWAKELEAKSPYTIDADGASLAIFRLAPADYHRFHSPVSGVVVYGPVDISGAYYTVNPQAVNERDFDVFTANKRSVIYVKDDVSGQIVAIVAVGALLVGSIGWSKPADAREWRVTRGDELGWFAYGGSTVIALFSRGMILFDEDLAINSKNSLETMVKVGDSLGVCPI